MKKKNKFKVSLQQKRVFAGYLFILPWFIGFLVFYVRSLIMTGQFAFSEMVIDTINGGYTLTPVGFENLRYAFLEHGTFKQVLTTSVTDMLVDVPLITFFSLFMAILLNKKFPGRFIVRAIFFLPIILNADAVTDVRALSEMMAGGASGQAVEITESAAATLAFDVDYLINMFMNLGLPAKILDYITQAVARINDIISLSGVQIIIFIAALQSIPSSMYEVAKMEGATGYETFWKVTFPMVMPHIITNVVYTIVDSFTNSEVVTLARTTMDQYQYGLSAVFSLSSTIITCAILVVVCAFIQKKTFYYN